jgi:hypothetical protein
MGNRVFVTESGFTYANSPTLLSLNTSTIGKPTTNPALTNSFHYQAAQSTSEAAILAASGSGVISLGKTWAALSTTGKVVVGGGAGGGFDAAGQLYKGEDFRYGQTLVATTTGALAGPVASTSVWGNALLGGVVGAGNTTATNAIYGDDASVFDAGANGAVFSGLGTSIGSWTTSTAGKLLPTHIGGNPINHSIPILFQNFGKPNPYPGYAGSTVEQLISNIPSFTETPEQKGVKP